MQTKSISIDMRLILNLVAQFVYLFCYWKAKQSFKGAQVKENSKVNYMQG